MVQFLGGETVEDITDTMKSILKSWISLFYTWKLLKNAVSITSRGILNKLRQIKPFIVESYNWNWNVIISQAALHSDNGKDNGKKRHWQSINYVYCLMNWI